MSHGQQRKFARPMDATHEIALRRREEEEARSPHGSGTGHVGGGMTEKQRMAMELGIDPDDVSDDARSDSDGSGGDGDGGGHRGAADAADRVTVLQAQLESLRRDMKAKDAEVREARAARDKAEDSVRRVKDMSKYSAVVMKKTFEGKLTKQQEMIAEMVETLGDVEGKMAKAGVAVDHSWAEHFKKQSATLAASGGGGGGGGAGAGVASAAAKFKGMAGAGGSRGGGDDDGGGARVSAERESKLVASVNELKAANERLQADLESARAAPSGSGGDAQGHGPPPSAYKALEEKYAKAKVQRRELKNRLDALRPELEASQKKVAELEAAVASAADGKQAEVSGSGGGGGGGGGGGTASAEELAAAQARVTELEGQLEESQEETEATQEELMEESDKVANLAHKLLQTEAKLEEAQQALEAAQKGSAEAAAASAGSEQLAAEVASVKAELQTTKEALGKAAASAAKYKERAHALKEAHGTQKDELGKLAEQLQQAASNMEVLEGKLADAEAAGKASHEEVASLRRQLDEASSGSKEALAAIERERDEAQARAEALAKEVSALKESVEEERKGAEAAQSAVAEAEERATTSIRAAKDKAKRREEKLRSAAEDQLKKMKAAFTEELGQVEAAEKKSKAKLQERLDDARSQLRSYLQSVRGATTAVHGAVVGSRKSWAALRDTAAAELAAVAPLFELTATRIVKKVRSEAKSNEVIIAKYRKEMAERKRLFNLVQELRGNIRVYCRARPMLEFERAAGQEEAVTFEEDGEITVRNSKKAVKKWEFEHVFRPGQTNEEVYREVEGLVVSAMDGYNVCIFAYGQTGSGKTHTMEGDEGNRGVNFRALRSLFALAEERSDDHHVTIEASLLEIYNESIKDMVSPSAKKLEVRSGDHGMTVPGLTVAPVASIDEVLKMMRRGYANRSTFATNMNEHSSRSHSMLSVYMTTVNKISGVESRGKLHLVDLAGSERISKSGATGDRLKEAQNINKSLSALGDVIAARAQKNGHIPFRNSTLTYLLSDSLQGNSKTLMFVNLSPTLQNADETFCSLNFAARVRTVELGKASKNVGRSGAGAGSGDGSSKRSSRK